VVSLGKKIAGLVKLIEEARLKDAKRTLDQMTSQ
jgi:hypothetical protein